MNITFYTTRTSKNITVIKQWEDENNKSGNRPSSIFVELMQNNTTIQEAEIKESDNWQYTFENLDLYDSENNEYQYEVKERDSIDGYFIRDVNINEDTYTITN